MLLWLCFEGAGNFCTLLNSICQTFRQNCLSRFCSRSEHKSALAPDIPLVLGVFRSEGCFAIAVGCRVELT